MAFYIKKIVKLQGFILTDHLRQILDIFYIAWTPGHGWQFFYANIIEPLSLLHSNRAILFGFTKKLRCAWINSVTDKRVAVPEMSQAQESQPTRFWPERLLFERAALKIFGFPAPFCVKYVSEASESVICWSEPIATSSWVLWEYILYPALTNYAH